MLHIRLQTYRDFNVQLLLKPIPHLLHGSVVGVSWWLHLPLESQIQLSTSAGVFQCRDPGLMLSTAYLELPVSIAAAENELKVRGGRGSEPGGGYTPRAGYSEVMVKVWLSVPNQLHGRTAVCFEGIAWCIPLRCKHEVNEVQVLRSRPHITYRITECTWLHGRWLHGRLAAWQMAGWRCSMAIAA